MGSSGALPVMVQGLWRTLLSMPFENLSKIVKYRRVDGDSRAALREPGEVWSDHLRLGTGGTCFALTYWLWAEMCGKVPGLRLCLADRHYGEGTHACILLEVAGALQILDAGYLFHGPLPPAGEERVFTCAPNPNSIRIVHRAPGRYEVGTSSGGDWVYRYLLNDRSVADDEYRRFWEKTFTQEMMGYPVLNRIADGEWVYLQKRRLYVGRGSQRTGCEVRSSQLAGVIGKHYGINPVFVLEALSSMGEGRDLI
ncbi:MAG: hypothetical protein HQL31_05940 [Planctomycetes bacterium]|nr:hypothetical protein [Planctomycetota bacterium]